MLACGRRHAELFLSTDIDALGGAGALGDPGRVDVNGRGLLCRLRVSIVTLPGLLLEVHEQSGLQVPVDTRLDDPRDHKWCQCSPHSVSHVDLV